MKIVRQTERGLCLAACVAMVANCTIEEVVEKTRILKSQDGVRFLPDNEAIKFLASRFLCYGLRLAPNSDNLDEDTSDFTVTVTTDCPAILAVPSENFPGFNHAVVWDNEQRKILDPLYDEPQPLSRYKVLEWVPISHV